jgi:hypothetical protein
VLKRKDLAPAPTPAPGGAAGATRPAHYWSAVGAAAVVKFALANPVAQRLLRRFLGGEKATLLWDGLPAHPSTAMRAWLNTQRSWLVVEWLPAYAPDLNPVEGLWSSLKATELANLTAPTLGEVIAQAQRGSSGSAGPRTWPTRFFVEPACRCRDTPQVGAPSRRSPRGPSWSRGTGGRW